MDRYSSRIKSIRKELLELNRRLKELYSDRRHVLRVLNRANKDYSSGKISYEEYSRVWDSTLQGYSVEELIGGYSQHIRALENKKKDLESETRELKKNRSKANKSLSISLSLILVFGIITGLSMFDTQLGEITGAAVTGQRVVVRAYYAIQLSNTTISYESFSSGYPENLSAKLNNESSGPTGYYLELSNDSNVPIKVNISAGGDLTNGTNIIGIGNMTWSCSNYSNMNVPSLENDSKLSTSYIVTTENFSLWYNDPAKSKAYYRFWIDIPSGQEPGTYTNNITFTAYRTS